MEEKLQQITKLINIIIIIIIIIIISLLSNVELPLAPSYKIYFFNLQQTMILICIFISFAKERNWKGWVCVCVVGEDGGC